MVKYDLAQPFLRKQFRACMLWHRLLFFFSFSHYVLCQVSGLSDNGTVIVQSHDEGQKE